MGDNEVPRAYSFISLISNIKARHRSSAASHRADSCLGLDDDEMMSMSSLIHCPLVQCSIKKWCEV